jgi:EAL domain-containing protein (putative c-di-GMP-specific phosphodiesterase class I)
MLRVNVSPAQLVAAGFAQDVAEIVASSGIDVGSICLEITEGLLFKDIETVRANVAALKQVGVQVAVDDFGTGYSAFSRLKALPVDAVKIDKSFVQNLGSDVDDLAIVRTIIALADAFGIDVIAEGVETVLAAETLLRLGCRRAQGYLFSRPIDDMAMQNLLKNPRLPVPRNDSTFQAVGVRQNGTLE